MSQSTAPVQPVRRIKMWPIEAAIWKNGDSYSVTLSKAYKDGDAWKHTNTLFKDDLLLAAKVIDHAHTAVLKLEFEDYQKANPQQ